VTTLDSSYKHTVNKSRRKIKAESAWSVLFVTTLIAFDWKASLEICIFKNSSHSRINTENGKHFTRKERKKRDAKTREAIHYNIFIFK
jgi:hypothetical protein